MTDQREPKGWYCGCGWANGLNSVVCGMCGRNPHDGAGVTFFANTLPVSPAPQEQREKIIAYLDALDEIATIGSTPPTQGGQHVQPPAYRMTPSTAKNIKWNTQAIRELLASYA